MATRKRKPATSRMQKSHRPISGADIQFARTHGAAALEYFHTLGLAEVRRRALRLILSAAVPCVGLLWLHWSPIDMALYTLADMLITILADLARLPLAAPWMKASLQRDMDANEVLLIVDGLEDGSGERIETGREARPGVILIIGVVCSALIVPLALLGLKHLGWSWHDAWRTADGWWALVAANAVLTVGGALLGAVQIRRTTPGRALICVESGAIGALYAGLLCLVWLPIKFGLPGLLWMFLVMHAVRLAFGVFALVWMPRAVHRIARRLRADDWQPRRKARTGPT